MHFMTYETLVENEADQVLGVVHVGDFGSVGPKHVAMFNITGKHVALNLQKNCF